MSGITIDASSFEAFESRMVEAGKNAERVHKKAVGVLASKVRTNAVVMILSLTPRGDQYKRYKPTRRGTASAPGDPPHSDTRELADNIIVREIVGGYEIVSRAEYSTALEFGTERMAARPFLAPALAQALPNLGSAIRDAWLEYQQG